MSSSALDDIEDDDNTKSPYIGVNEVYQFNEAINTLRFNIEWYSAPGVICDLDVSVFTFDDRARLIEKVVDSDSNIEEQIEDAGKKKVKQMERKRRLLIGSKAHSTSQKKVEKVRKAKVKKMFLLKIKNHCKLILRS